MGWVGDQTRSVNSPLLTHPCPYRMLQGPEITLTQLCQANGRWSVVGVAIRAPCRADVKIDHHNDYKDMNTRMIVGNNMIVSGVLLL